jgi:hypothetical protein
MSIILLGRIEIKRKVMVTCSINIIKNFLFLFSLKYGIIFLQAEKLDKIRKEDYNGIIP